MEEKLLKDCPDPVTIEEKIKILEQMKNCICKIYLNNGSGTGFFCYVPFENDFKLPVLITNYQVIGDEYLKINKEINISLNDESFQINIFLDNNRKIYTNKIYDITIIEIIKDDQIKIIFNSIIRSSFGFLRVVE